MRIGLIRHFPVNYPMLTGWLTAAELHQWRQHYDSAELQPQAYSALDGWQRCLSSDLSRTYVTAQALYSGDVQQTPLLREPEIVQFQTGELQLPHWAWRWVLRLAWLTGHRSQRNARDDFLQRVKAVMDMTEASHLDTLVVSHAGMMIYLREELLKRGYTGPKFRVADHARLYVFEKSIR